MKIELTGTNVKCLTEDMKSGKYSTEYSLQREAGNWNKAQQSLLIHSLLMGYDIPNIYLKREVTMENNRPKETFIIIDGVQRTSAICDYINNNFSLDKNLEAVELFGKSYDIAGKRFKKLPEELQEHLMHRRIDIKELVNYTDEQIEEQFYRLNNGSEFKKQQIATVKLGEQLAKEFKPVAELPFWERSGLSKAQRKHGFKMSTALQSMMLMTGYNYGSKLGVSEVLKYAEYLSDIYANTEQTEEGSIQKEKLSENIKTLKTLFEKLDICLCCDDEINKMLKPIHIPVLITFLKNYVECNEGKSIEDTVMDEDFVQSFFTEFFSKLNENEEAEYLKYCGMGSTNGEKVTGRLNAIENAFYDYCERFGTVSDGTETAIEINAVPENADNMALSTRGEAESA